MGVAGQHLPPRGDVAGEAEFKAIDPLGPGQDLQARIGGIADADVDHLGAEQRGAGGERPIQQLGLCAELEGVVLLRAQIHCAGR